MVRGRGWSCGKNVRTDVRHYRADGRAPQTCGRSCVTNVRTDVRPEAQAPRRTLSFARPGRASDLNSVRTESRGPVARLACHTGAARAPVARGCATRPATRAQKSFVSPEIQLDKFWGADRAQTAAGCSNRRGELRRPAEATISSKAARARSHRTIACVVATEGTRKSRVIRKNESDRPDQHVRWRNP